MPLIEAALAFAITMLALSLIVSSFVEIIHRTLKLRERGLEYMLRQLFDQVLKKYLEPAVTATVTANQAIAEAARNAEIQRLLADMRGAFVKRMVANRAPIGLEPDETLAANAAANAQAPRLRLGNIWGGRRVTALSPTDFMERLGSADVGTKIKDAVEAAAVAAGQNAADRVDAVIRDIAQKFDGFGKDAAGYFEGRARMMSVIVAIALAFAAHVDAVDLFRTYLRDPNARAKVIEQSQAVTAQYQAAKEAADAVSKLTSDTKPPPPDVTKEIEKIQQDWKAAIGNVNATVTEYAGLGVPLGWTTARIDAANMSQWVWTCKDDKGEDMGWTTLQSSSCKADEADYKAGPKHTQYVDVWFEVPKSPSVIVYLFLGGLLIGLGSPFWYDAVTGLTNIRNVAKDVGGGGQPATPHPPAQVVVAQVAPGQPVQVQPVQAPAPNRPDRPQPVTPVGAFTIALAARAAAPAQQQQQQQQPPPHQQE